MKNNNRILTILLAALLIVTSANFISGTVLTYATEAAASSESNPEASDLARKLVQMDMETLKAQYGWPDISYYTQNEMQNCWQGTLMYGKCEIYTIRTFLGEFGGDEYTETIIGCLNPMALTK